MLGLGADDLAGVARERVLVRFGGRGDRDQVSVDELLASPES